MHLNFRNVNDAFDIITWGMHRGHIPTDVGASRYGEVMRVEETVTVSYSHPRERVLLCPGRDANPFFHLYESLWMLAGRNDVAPLAYYNSRMPEFSDDGGNTFNGAYGYRWRHALAPMWVGDDIGYPPGSQEPKPVIDEPRSMIVDQLVLIVEHLRASPHSRRAVLQMWNVQDDLLKVDTGKDLCCNLSVLFKVEMGRCRQCEGSGYEPNTTHGYPCQRCDGKPHECPRYLNMVVFNRSNDLVWGLLGANVVQFSMLQEYLAAHLGLEVGRYDQVTADLHAYTDTWEPEKWLADVPHWQHAYERHNWSPTPLVASLKAFEEQLPDFVEYHKEWCHGKPLPCWTEPFLKEVAHPMCMVYGFYKRGEYKSCLRWLELVVSPDWRAAAQGWVARRLARKGVSV
jgi:thymidylate synthase